MKSKITERICCESAYIVCIQPFIYPKKKTLEYNRYTMKPKTVSREQC
jgi:hypothetical protein